MFNYLRGVALILVIILFNIISLQAEVLYGEKLGDDWIWFVEGNEKNYKFYGEIKNGVPDGQGTLTDPSGKKSVVEFKNGKLKEVSTVEKPVIVESVVEAPKPVVVEEQ